MPAPDVQGLANWVIDDTHLIRGDRMSLYGDNLFAAAALVVGDITCPILDPTSADYFGYDTISFHVPATLTPTRPDGTVAVQVTNADGTGSVFFEVARPGPWIQPADTASTYHADVTGFEQVFSAVVADDPDAPLTQALDPADPGWDGTTAPAEHAQLRFGTQHVGGSVFYSLAIAYTLWSIYDRWWSRTEFPPASTPPDALGWYYEGSNTQNFGQKGTINYPATVTMRVKETIVAAETQTPTGGDPIIVDNSAADPPSSWGGDDAVLEVRKIPNDTITAVSGLTNPHPTTAATPLMPTDVAAAALLTSQAVEPLVTDSSPDVEITFDVDDTDFAPSSYDTGNQMTFGLFLDKWAAEAWFGFPADPATDLDQNVRRVQATIADLAPSTAPNAATVTAAATYTPLRYRFIYPVTAAAKLRQFPRDDTPRRQGRRNGPRAVQSSRRHGHRNAYR